MLQLFTTKLNIKKNRDLFFVCKASLFQAQKKISLFFDEKQLSKSYEFKSHLILLNLFLIF